MFHFQCTCVHVTDTYFICIMVTILYFYTKVNEHLIFMCVISTFIALKQQKEDDIESILILISL